MPIITPNPASAKEESTPLSEKKEAKSEILLNFEVLKDEGFGEVSNNVLAECQIIQTEFQQASLESFTHSLCTLVLKISNIMERLFLAGNFNNSQTITSLLISIIVSTKRYDHRLGTELEKLITGQARES